MRLIKPGFIQKVESKIQEHLLGRKSTFQEHVGLLQGGVVAEWVRAATGRSMVRVPLR